MQGVLEVEDAVGEETLGEDAAGAGAAAGASGEGVEGAAAEADPALKLILVAVVARKLPLTDTEPVLRNEMGD